MSKTKMFDRIIFMRKNAK